MLKNAEVLIAWQSEQHDERFDVLEADIMTDGSPMRTYDAIQMHKGIIADYKGREEVFSFSTVLCITYDSGRTLILDEGDGA